MITGFRTAVLGVTLLALPSGGPWSELRASADKPTGAMTPASSPTYSSDFFVVVPAGRGLRMNSATFNSAKGTQAFVWEVKLADNCNFEGGNECIDEGSCDRRIPPAGPTFQVRIVGTHLAKGKWNGHDYKKMLLSDGKSVKVQFWSGGSMTTPNLSDTIVVNAEWY